jgi:hypothetical protein
VNTMLPPKLLPLVAIGVLLACAAHSYDRLPAGVWYLRVTNPRDTARKLCVRVYVNPNQDPWAGDTIYVGQGGERQDAPAAEQWLAPGQTSDWVDLGPHMSRRPAFGSADAYLSPVLLGAMYDPAGERLRLTAELARGPEKRLVRRLEANDPRPTKLGCSTWLGATPLPTLALLVPVNPDSGQRIWTAEEAAQQQLDWIAACGPTPVPPREILFICHQWQVAFQNPTRLQALNTAILRRLGYNNLTQFVGNAADVAAIRATGWEPIRALHVSRGDGEKKAQELKDQGIWEWVRLANFGDETDLQLQASPTEQDAAFVEYLRGKGLRPLDFVRPADQAAAGALPEAQQWGFVHLGGSLPPAQPKLLFEAATFRYQLWTKELAADRAQVSRYFPRGALVGSNFSPHLSVWPDVRKWINVVRDGGLTMPWSEDWWWQVPEASPQSYGLLLDALRHAADYHRAPFCFYTIPDPGETPEHLLRMNYFALGHQAKVIDHFAIYNQIFGTCDYIDFEESREKFRVIHRVLTDVGKMDARLYRARMRPAQAAILLSIADDVWNTADLLAQDPPQENLYYAQQNADNHERKALWLALRHAQLPVDLVTDEDAASGMLQRYKVLYVAGLGMLREAAPKLRQWVEAGGTLVAVGGGGMVDQYRQPLREMQDLYGVRDIAFTKTPPSLAPARDLPTLQPRATLAFDAAHGGVKLPALCALVEFTATAGTPVVARFGNGTPAATERRVGRGRVLFIGALPGLAYLQPGQVQRQGMPEVFPADIRHLITDPAESAGVARQVITSDPLVEATLQEGRRGAVVTLISFRNQPGREVAVTLAGLPKARKVSSLRHGPLSLRQTTAGPKVTLPVDQGDFLVVD